jgi:hypothetical protein
LMKSQVEPQIPHNISQTIFCFISRTDIPVCRRVDTLNVRVITNAHHSKP